MGRTCGMAPEGHWRSVGIVNAMSTDVVGVPVLTFQLSSVLFHCSDPLCTSPHAVFQRMRKERGYVTR